MAVSYKKLFKLLIDKDMKKKDFCELTGVSPSTLRKLNHGENVQMDILESICLKLPCELTDIVEIMPDPEPSPKNWKEESV